MAQYDYTAADGKKAATSYSAAEAVREQSAVATYTANVTAGEARRDAAHLDLFDALTELGEIPPALPWVNGVSIDTSGGDWVLTVDEA